MGGKSTLMRQVCLASLMAQVRAWGGAGRGRGMVEGQGRVAGESVVEPRV